MAINESGDKMYELSNHLGNVLNVVADRKLPIQLGSTGTVDYYVSNVMSYSDYYPFGMQVPNKHGNVSDFRYGFQGQESDDEVKGDGNSVNYKYRMHDPRIGRFFAVDPLAGDYPHYTPYSFSGNKVIAWRELEGLEEFIAIVTPSLTDPLLKQTFVVKIKDDGPLKVTYINRNSDGSILNIEEPIEQFKFGSAESFAMDQNWKSTGKSMKEMMSVSTYTINSDGSLSISQVTNPAPKSALAARMVFQYDLKILFKTNKAEITKEELQNGTFLDAKNGIEKFQQTIGCPVQFANVNGQNQVKEFDLTNWQMVVSGETDSQPSKPPFPSVENDQGILMSPGNPSLGQERANNLLHEISPAHSENNSTRVINHTGTIKSKDRNSSIFFVPKF